MGKVINALSGVIVSGGLVAGAYVLDNVESRAGREEAALCIEAYEGEALATCISEVTEDSDSVIPDIIGMAGVAGILGSGYLGYKALKIEVGTTGLIEDYL